MMSELMCGEIMHGDGVYMGTDMAGMWWDGDRSCPRAAL